MILLATLFGLVTAEPVETKFASGKLKAKYATDAEGRKHGPYVEYFENGKVRIKATCKAGEWDGPYASFHPNGKPHVSATYKEGKLTGAYSEKSEQGGLRLSATYKDGKLTGLLKLYAGGVPVCSHDIKDDDPPLPRRLAEIHETLVSIYGTPGASKKVDELTAERHAALRRLKAYRYLVGVPWENVELDDELNKYATAGAKLCERIGKMDHAPKNPGLPEEEYKIAYRGTSQSNLFYNLTILDKCVDGWMDDSDDRNIDRLGHRRWCINPALRLTGFGKSARFAAMMAHDKSQPAIPDYDFISYPAPGFMPIAYFGPKHAWSVSLNPKKYQKPVASAVKITVTPLPPRGKPGAPLALNYRNVETGNFGVPYCLIFRPEGLVLSDGTRYAVTIQGLELLDGTPAPIKFQVFFVSL
jgi:hypothetical protein